MPEWYAIHSKPNKEDLLTEQLMLRGVTACCPHLVVHPANPRARKLKPYFPGYVFALVNLVQTGLSLLKWTPGAEDLVSFGGIPASIPAEMVQAIMKNVDAINALGGEKRTALKHGETVLIQQGSFNGYEAIFDTLLSGHERVRVFLKLLHQRQVSVNLPVAQIEPIKRT